MPGELTKSYFSPFSPLPTSLSQELKRGFVNLFIDLSKLYLSSPILSRLFYLWMSKIYKTCLIL